MDSDRMNQATDVRPEALSREVLFDVLDGLPLGIAVHAGPTLTYAYLNDELQRMSGDRELLGRPFGEAWPEFADRAVPIMLHVVKTGEPYSAEDQPFGLDMRGGPREPNYVTFSFSRIRLADGSDAVLVAALDTTEEVRARRRAEREAAQLDEVFERMGDSFFALDREWRFTYVNAKAEQLLGISRDTSVGRSIWELFGDAVGSTFDEEFHRAMRNQTPVTFQEYYPPLDMWASVQAYPSETGLSVFLSNITSLKEREAALAASEGQLRTVIDNSPNVVQMKDVNGVFIRVNDEFARLFGLPKEAIIGKSDRDLLLAESADRLEQNDREVREAGRPLQFEEDVTTPARGGRRYLTTKFPLKDASGRVYGTAGISTDITERAEQERARTESEERFRKIFEEGPVGIVLLKPDRLEILRANDTYARMTGYSKDELTRLTLFDLTHPEDRPKARQLANLVLSGEIPFYRWEKRYVHKDGTIFWVSVTGSLLRDEEGRPSLFLGMVEDITQRKQAETALRDRDLAIRKAYTDVISAVTGGKLILLTPEELPGVLGRQVSPTWRADEYQQFSVLRHELAEVLRTQAMSDDEVGPYVLAATEAVTNAVKHGGGGRMCARRSEHAIQIEVSDNGPGIDFEDLPRAALMAGFSTKASLGMGFAIMLDVCDRVLLTTQPGLTTVVLEKDM